MQYAGESLQDFDDSSDDDGVSSPTPTKQKPSRKPVDQPLTPAPAERQQQQRRATPQNPAPSMRVDTPVNSAAPSNRYSDVSPDTPISSNSTYNRRSNEQRMRGDWEDPQPSEQYRPVPTPNQYAPAAAPQYTPPPPPPRPAKVPTEHNDAEDRNSNLGRYAYSSQDLNSRDRQPTYDNVDGQTSARRARGKISNFLKA
jgi:hypothetical protein